MVGIKPKKDHLVLSLFYLDHTYGTSVGYYMYIETSFPQQENDQARLISPEYTITSGGSCLQFFYHMWGRSTGTLNVFLKEGTTIQGSPLWSLRGDQGNLWRSARATIRAAGQYQVNTPINLSIHAYLSLDRFRRCCWSRF